MMKDHNIETIKGFIRGFEIPQRDCFTECMLIAQTNDSFYYKGGIFICNKDSVNAYAGISEFWVRSFYALVENAWIGDFFHKVIPLIHWKETSSEKFSKQYSSLLKECTFEQNFLKAQTCRESHVNLENRKFNNAVNILDDLITSSIAISSGDYISYFTIDDDVGLKHKWPK